MMTILENLIFALGLTVGLLLIGVLCRPHGLQVIRQAAEVLMGVVTGDLIYQSSDKAQNDPEAQSEINKDQSWTLQELMRLERGLYLLKLLHASTHDSEDDDKVDITFEGEDDDDDDEGEA